MGMFICCECGRYADSDDGCEECIRHKSSYGLICSDCTDNMEDDEFKRMTGRKP